MRLAGSRPPRQFRNLVRPFLKKKNQTSWLWLGVLTLGLIHCSPGKSAVDKSLSPHRCQGAGHLIACHNWIPMLCRAALKSSVGPIDPLPPADAGKHLLSSACYSRRAMLADTGADHTAAEAHVCKAHRHCTGTLAHVRWPSPPLRNRQEGSWL